MDTFNIQLDFADMTKQFDSKEQFGVTKSEIETVIGVLLRQYIKDGWITEVVATEVRHYRANPVAWRKDAGLE